jgi:hypothetical protein
MSESYLCKVNFVAGNQLTSITLRKLSLSIVCMSINAMQMIPVRIISTKKCLSPGISAL